MKLFVYVLGWLFFVRLSEELGRCNISSLSPRLELATKATIILLRDVLCRHPGDSLLVEEFLITVSVLKFICAPLASSEVIDLRLSKEIIAEEIGHAVRGDSSIGLLGFVELAARSHARTASVPIRILLGLHLGSGSCRLCLLLLRKLILGALSWLGILKHLLIVVGVGG